MHAPTCSTRTCSLDPFTDPQPTWTCPYVSPSLDAKAKSLILRENEGLAIEAAEIALSRGNLDHALECLENGRLAFWTLAFQAAAQGISPELIEDLEEAIRRMEMGWDTRDDSYDTSQEWNHHQDIHKLRCEAHLKLYLERMQRRLDTDTTHSGLALKQFVQQGGSDYVIYLLNSPKGTRALAITPHGTIKHIPLPGASRELLTQVSTALDLEDVRYRSINTSPALTQRSFRKVYQSQDVFGSFEAALSALWNHVVGPICMALHLQKRKGNARPRIIWIPTSAFAFVPIHAAGRYGGMNEESCSDYFVSSYCPAFNSIPSTRGFRRTSTDRPKVLLVTASHAPDLPPLPNAQEEARLIQNLLPSCAHASLQQTSGLQETISSLSTASILHLACHGRQDRLNPLQSGFHLADGKLTIARIMEQNNPDALFAFLSACETAKGDDARPDQLIHLANAMIFAGFKSVIATMWEMGDVDGPLVANTVYQEFFKNKRLDLAVIPYALDDAAQLLRRQGVPAVRWATFIHIGT